MKNKMINAGICDAREVTEESLAGFDSVQVNAGILITSPRAKELMNRYPVRLNTAMVLEVPDGQEVSVKILNGKAAIGPGDDGTGIFLIVNGRLTVGDGSLEAVKSYYRILVNGRLLMPEGYRGRVPDLSVNGSTEYYPDGATLLKGDTDVDDLFAARAAGSLYYCPGTLFFLDPALDPGKLLEKDLRFTGRKIVAAESLLAALVSRFDEETEIVRVPDGTVRLGGGLDLTAGTVRRYGTKLYVSGDVSILDGEALSSLEYLYAEGEVTLRKDLEDAFGEIRSVCRSVKILDPEVGILSGRPSVRVGTAVLEKYPKGVRIEDCAKVLISEDLSPQVILEKLRISDCALVVCTKEQEEAVNLVAEDAAMIRTAGQDGEEAAGGETPGNPNENVSINAAEYKM